MGGVWLVQLAGGGSCLHCRSNKTSTPTSQAGGGVLPTVMVVWAAVDVCVNVAGCVV